MYRGSGGRINERDVPESQHTVFIRGLPGNMSTDEIREFFGKDFGSCTFDFVKVSPDRTKLYVAVRFDSKVAAREVMERFATDGELLGYKVEMTWFRDIRRYLAHCAKQGIRPNRFRGGRADHRRDDDRYRARERGRSRSLTRSPERGGEAGRSRSASAASRNSHAEQQHRSLSRSHSTQSHSRSRSLSHAAEGRAVHDGLANNLEREKSLEYSDIDEKERHSPPRALSPSPPPLKKSKKEKRKKEKRQRRSKHLSPLSTEQRKIHSGSQSDAEMGGEEEDVMANGGRKMLKLESMSPVNSKIFIGPVKPIVPQAPPAQKSEQSPQMIPLPLPPTFYQRQLPAGVVAAGATNDATMLGNTTDQMQRQMASSTHNQQQMLAEQRQMMPKVELRNQSITLDLSEPKSISPSKFKPIGELSDYQQLNGSKEFSDFQMSANSSQPPPMIRNVPMPPTAAVNDCSAGMGKFFSSAPIQEPGLLLNNFKEIQCEILHDVRYKAPEKEEKMGTIQLTSLSRKGPTEEKREEKMAKLTPELRERVNRKRRQLELSYRNDCEAYGLVVNKLIAKDRALEDRLKFLLLETMKDLEAETVKQLDEFLDQLSICA